MAVNTQKFLPSSKSVALAKVSQNIAKGSSSLGITESAQKNIGIISVKVIEIDKILKGTLASQKKQLDNQKRQQSSQRREKQEEKLETKPDAEKGKMTMPKAPRFGIFDWIKNFIGNIILGYFAVRLVDHLPKIIPIVKFIGKATDLVLDIGGKLLDGLVTFIDIGYKAVDFSRGLVGKTFGEEALKNLDKLTSEFEKFMNLAIIVGMASADFGMDRLRDMGAKKATEKGAGTLARRGAGRVATRTAARVGGKGAAKLTAKVGSKVLKAVPFLGAGLAIVEGIMRIKDGDYVGGLLSFGSAIPVAGWAFLALDIAREFMGGQEFDKSVGRSFGGKPGLTDKQVQKRTPHMSGPSFMGLAGGGVTRGGKKQTGARRTISKGGRKGKYKRTIARKPGEVQISSPGADVGGEDKLFGVFPNPFKKVVDTFNPFKNTVDAGKNLGKSDYFGPILAITSKILLGQKPNQKDYENVGLGINLLISKGIDAGKLKGGVVSAFAEGGLVDPKALEAISEGGDISKWVADTFKQSTETNAQKTLREIQQNLKLKRVGTEREDDRIDPDQPIDAEDGGYSTNAGDYKELLDLIASVESKSAGGYNAYNEGGAAGGYKVVGYGGDSRKGPLRRALVDMTIKEIMAHQKNINPPIHAAGRYQIIGSTLKALINGNYGPTGVAVSDTFSPDVQDKLGIALIRYRLKTGATSDNFISEWRGLKFADKQKLQSAISKAQRGRTYRIDVAGTDRGEGGVIGGSGNFIQGNSGNSRGVHFHIGPGSQTKGTILQSQYNADARASAAKVVDHFLKKGSTVYDGRRGAYYKSSKEVAEAQRAHTASGSQGGIDLQVDFEKPVPFPLRTLGMAFRPNGFGVSADIAGSNSFVAHGRYDEKGKKAPQTGGLVAYARGGETLDGPHMAMVGEKGREIVIDNDSVESHPEIRGMLLAINQASNYQGVLKAIQQYAPYDAMSPQTVIIPSSPIDNTPEDYSSQSSGGFAMFAVGEADDPFKTLYQGT
jgi:hypothetical protein